MIGHKDWKKLLKDISDFLEDKLAMDREEIQPYDAKLLKLVAVDFVS
ncbi:MAG: hypothetical protein L0Y62_00605 [Nitrospirae bacterium]|nr:hypothetical protein [Nitrospirota bacterium]